MTDPNTPTTSSNPQDLIDQALGGTTTTPPTPPEPTLPIPEPLSPPTTTEPAIEQKPEDVVATPTIETVPVELTSAQTKPMGEDMPLSFATTEPENNQNVEMPVSPMPKVEPVDTVVPPATLGAASFQPSPKKKSNKIMVAIIGFFAFLGVMGAMGYYAYDRYGTIEPATIAAVSDMTREQCNGCSKPVNGGWYKWIDGQCKISGSCNSSNENQNTENPNIGSAENANSPSACSSANGTWCDSIDSLGKRYSFCISNLSNKGCNLAAVERGYTITYGSSWREQDDSTYKYYCDCDGSGSHPGYYFDKPGVCNNSSVTKEGGPQGANNPNFNNKDGVPLGNNIGTGPSQYNYDKYGLCGIVNRGSTSETDENIGKYNDCFTCSNTGCSITSDTKKTHCNVCSVVKYSCNASTNLTGTFCGYNGNETTNSGPGKSQNSSGKCGTVEQIDVMCGSVGYIQSRTIINPECTEKTPNPSTPTVTINPTLMCSSLTRTPNTTPAIGDKLTFTCAGASTPAGAVNMTYKFRYSINNGSYTSLTNKTATTAELTIATCGGYKVQCQACGTINGVLTCDPNWTAATQ